MGSFFFSSSSQRFARKGENKQRDYMDYIYTHIPSHRPSRSVKKAQVCKRSKVSGEKRRKQNTMGLESLSLSLVVCNAGIYHYTPPPMVRVRRV